MGPPFGKYYIPDEKLSKFHNFYHHHVFDNGFDCHIVERHQTIGPIVIDLDFKYEMNSGGEDGGGEGDGGDEGGARVEGEGGGEVRGEGKSGLERDDRRYTPEMINEFIKMYFQEMNKILVLGVNDHASHRIEDIRSAFIFEKPKPSVNPKKKNELKDKATCYVSFCQYYAGNSILSSLKRC